MTVDYLKALNVGSGLNTTDIVDAIIAATKAPQETIIQTKIEKKSVSISALGQLKSELTTLDRTLDRLDGQTGLEVTTNNAAVDIEETGNFALNPFRHDIEVRQIATPHTLSFVGFDTAQAAVDITSLQFEFGHWDEMRTGFTTNPNRTAQTISIDPEHNSIAEIAEAINAAALGVEASILKLHEGNYALTLIGPSGADHQMRITSAGSSQTPPPLNYDPETHIEDARHFARAGQNAEFDFNGVAIIREHNEIEDLIAGVTLTLNAPTSEAVTLRAHYDEEGALDELTGFVQSLNAMITSLDGMTYRGTPGEEDGGPLAQDNLAKSYLRILKSLTTEPIIGFGDEDLFLSNFGVMTQRDGTLDIDETKFKAFFAAHPDSFSAVMNSRVMTQSSLIHPTLTGTAWQAGRYEFTIDTDGEAQLDGTALIREEGVYKMPGGPAQGLALAVLGGGEASTVYIGKSVLDIVRAFAQPLIASGSEITTRIQNYTDDLHDYQEDLTVLNMRMDTERARYTRQFSEMNAAVNSFKKTETLLTNFMDSWKASLNN